MPNVSVDIGDLCTHCGRNTSAWSGDGPPLFVNRIPSDTDGTLILDRGEDVVEISVTVEGYMCEECQCVECDKCNEMVTDYSISEAGEVLCSTCGG